MESRGIIARSSGSFLEHPTNRQRSRIRPARVRMNLRILQVVMQESTSKVILVFGGAGGIGAEVSAQLAAAGATVVIADLNAVQAQAKAGVTCDITDPDSCESAAQAAVDRFGRLDGMVNCAGISRPHDSISLPPADWARMVDVQLNGAFYAAQACAKHMWNAGGAIVCITSPNAKAASHRRAADRSS